MFEMGAVVGLGLLVTLAKLPWKWKMWVISHPLFIDVMVMIMLLIIHWGTYSGVMVATIGALTCSLVLAGARKVVGHNENGRYVPGWFNIAEMGKLAPQPAAAA